MKKYIEVYEYYKSLIESNQLKKGDKLPSIRKATQILSVSKTTIENAYFELQADGYIVSSEKSGFYVTNSIKNEIDINNDKTDNANVIYDIKSGGSDIKCFDINLWQRYIKSALRQQERLMTYSEPQGEEDLRVALAQYVREKRNVVASPDRIVIGAGVHTLLQTLSVILDNKCTVSFPDNSFVLGMNTFKDYGFEVGTRNKNADIIYVSPSHMTAFGDVMPIKRRLELVNYSKEHNSLVIEDDYDNEFLYQSKPMPSLYALSNANNVVYISSFSNLLIPGIRISFMVLTEELARLYRENIHKFTQTASKTEQIALCQYLRDGKINSQTRKVRRLYTQKTKTLADMLSSVIPNAQIQISENLLQIKLTASYNGDINEFERRGVAINIVDHTGNKLIARLNPSALAEEKFEEAANLVKQILK